MATQDVRFAWKLDISSYKKLVKQADDLTRKQFDNLNKGLKESTEGYRRLGRATKKAGEGIGRSAVKARRESGKAAKATGREWEKAAKKAENKWKDSLDGISRRSKKAAKGIAKAVAVFGTLAAVGIAHATNEASKLETKLTEVTTLLGDTSVNEAFGKSIGEVREELIGLTGGLGSATELTEGLYLAISAGQKPAEAITFVEKAARLATAGLATTAQSVDLLTTALNAYGLSSSETARVSDVLFKTVERGKTTLGELAGSLGSVIPVAAALKIPIEEVGALIATLTAGGLGTDEATTAANALFTQFIAQAPKFKAAGIDMIAVLEEEGLTGAFRELTKLTGGNIEAMQKLIPNVRALKGVLGPTGAQAQVFNDNLQAMKDSAGATDLAFDKMRGTWAFVTKDLKEGVNAAFLTVGQTMIEHLGPALRDLIDNMGGTAGFIEVGKDVAKTIVELGRLFGEIVSPIEEATDAIRGMIEETVGATVSTSELFTGSLEAMVITAATVVIRMKQLFLGMALLITEQFLALPKAVGVALQKTLEGAAGLLAKLPGEVGLLLSDLAVGLGEQVGDGVDIGIDAVNDLGRRIAELDRQLADRKAFNFVGVGESDVLFGPPAPGGSRVTNRTGAGSAPTPTPRRPPGSTAPPKVRRPKAVADPLEGILVSIGRITQSDFDKKLGDMVDALSRLKDEGKEGTPVFDAMAQSIFDMVQKGEDNALAINEQAQEVSAYALGLTEAEAAQEAAKKKQEELTKAIENARQPMDDHVRAWEEWQEEVKRAQAVSDQMADSLLGLSLSILDGSTGLAQGIAGIGSVIADGVADGGSVGDALGAVFSTEGMSTAQQFAGGFSAGVGAWSENEGKGLGTQIGSVVGGGIGGFFFGPIGGALGSKIGGAIGGLFGGTPLHKKISKQVEKTFGGAISEGLSKTLAQITKSFGGDRELANVIGLAGIASEVGVTTDNFQEFADTALRGLQIVQEEGVGAEEVAASLNDTFSVLIGSAQQMGETGSDAFKELIKGALASGEEIEAVAKFIGGALTKAVGGLDQLTGSIGENISQERFDDLSTIASDIGRGFLAAGGDISELIPSLDNLIAKQKELGLEMSKSFKSLVSERNFIVNNEDTINNISGIREALEGLGKSTFLSSEGFSALQREAVRAFNAFGPESEGERRRALRATAGALQDLVNKSIERNEVLDAGTQALVDEADAIGLVEKSGTGLAATLSTQFDRLIFALTGELPAAIDVAMGALVSKTKGAFAQIGGALGDIGANVSSGPGAKFPGVPERAHGGPVQAGGRFLVGEQGPEIFEPRENGTIIDAQATARETINVGRPESSAAPVAASGAPPNMIVNVSIGSREIRNVVAELLEEILEDDLVAGLGSGG